MESPRGHILKFLFKQAQGMFWEMDIPQLKEKLLSRDPKFTSSDFDAALLELEQSGLVANGKLTDAGLEKHAEEYKAHLVACKATFEGAKVPGFENAIKEFDDVHAKVMSKKDKK